MVATHLRLGAILIVNFKVQCQWPLRLMREPHVLSGKLGQVVLDGETGV